MSRKPPTKEVVVSDGDAELRIRLLERLNLFQEKVERYDLYIKKLKKMLDAENPKIPILEIEKLISGVEQETGFGGNECTKDFGIGLPWNSSNVEAEYKQDIVKDEKVGMEMESNDILPLPDGYSKSSDTKHFVVVDLNTCETSDESFNLNTSETFDESSNQVNEGKMVADEEVDECSGNRPRQMGVKVATGGWFVDESGLAVLAHEDGFCSLYDVDNCEEKDEFKLNARAPSGIWRDCWILRVPGVDGCLGKYVVAASAGNVTTAGFCSWEFYSKMIQYFHIEDVLQFSRKHPVASTNSGLRKRDIPSANNPKWWYKPCGPLLASSVSTQRTVRFFDIRDGERVFKFETEFPVSTMAYCSSLHWRDKGKVAVAELDKISLWDVNSLTPRPLVSTQSCNNKITALHIGNADGESSKGVRKRVNQPDSVRNDGVFCTTDFINLLDFRHPSCVGMKIPITNVDVKSVFSIGDLVLLGASHHQLAGKGASPQVQQFSLRRPNPAPFATYPMPKSNTESISDDITQVWGDSNFVMAVSSLGLGRFLSADLCNTRSGVVLGHNDMYSPSFDFASSKILLISRDRPAHWMNII